MDILKTISDRTSYRGRYKDIAIPRDDLHKIMQAGLDAPSGCNQQTTSLIAVDDLELLAKIRQLVRYPGCLTAPAMIFVLTKKVVAYRDMCFNVQDYAAAIENMLLAIVDLGYQSCWIEGQITDAEKIGRQIADILQVPRDYDLVCLLPVGIAADPVRKASKKAFSERAWFNGYQK